MNSKVIIYNKEKIDNFTSLKQLCLISNIEMILLDEKMTQNKIKDILSNKIKKSKKKSLDYPAIIFSNISSNQMDQFLEKLRNNQIYCLKAVVTATNFNWTFENLYLHLLEESQKNK